MPPDTSLVDLITAILLVVVAVIGLVLNVLVILVLLQYKGLRTSFTAILFMICLLHILEYLIPLPMKILGDLLYDHVPSWSLGSTGCKAYNYAFYSLTYSIAYCIVLLVVDKYYDIKKPRFWNSEAAFAASAGVCLLCLLLNVGVLFLYDTVDEYINSNTQLQVCSLTTLKSGSLGFFFTVSFLLPILLTFLGVYVVSEMAVLQKSVNPSDVDKEFVSSLSVIIFSMGSYAILRLLWHVDRLVLMSGFSFDQGDLILQNVAEVTWYMSGMFISGYVIFFYPGVKEAIRDLCCGPPSVPTPVVEYEEEVVLMPVVTTEADPKRYDTWPQPGYKQQSGSTPSLISEGSTTILNRPDSPGGDQNWMIVRTLDRPKPKLKDYVDEEGRVRDRPLASSTLDRGRRSERESSARSRSTSPASDFREDKTPGTKRRFFRKKKLKSKERDRSRDKSREEEE